MPLPFQRVIRPKFYWVTASRRRKSRFLPLNFTTLRVSLELTERASFRISHYQSHFPIKRNQFPFSSLKPFAGIGIYRGDKIIRVFQEVSGLEMGMGSMWLE
ncbi:hypothetical protein CEXT_381141 [Caerostris extrusa]|uniref:Uncharacterized protein n=1 Tax=Caerostris extrusa TaxID=172846 RepID=A0AAV4SP87_CAEEX|nr:hypothetical protein CEXT_381141 [Caerostris extrusa]